MRCNPLTDQAPSVYDPSHYLTEGFAVSSQ
jgi:hypothetical protein